MYCRKYRKSFKPSRFRLDIIVKNARELVEKEFTYEAAVEKYRKILGSI